MKKIESVRIYFRNHPGISVVVVGLCVAISLIGLILQMRPPRQGDGQIDGIYHYDLETGALFVAPAGQILPVATGSGARPSLDHAGGVVAYVYGCGGCTRAEDRFIGCLLAHNPQVLGQIEDTLDPGVKLLKLGEHEAGLLVRAFDAGVGQPHGAWVPLQSREGGRILQDAARGGPCEPGVPVVRCNPER